MNRTYNLFYPWVKQDDFLTSWANFIEHKNLNGLRDGYWITLWPKVNKSIVSDAPIRWILAFQRSVIDTDRIIYAWEDGKIYNASSDTPLYTLSNWGHIIAIAELWNDYYFFYKTNLDDVTIDVAKVRRAFVQTNDIAWNIDETFKTNDFSSIGIPPIIVLNSRLYIGGNWTISTLDLNGTISNFWFPDDFVVWLTEHNSVINVYCRSGRMYVWDWEGTAYLWVNELSTRIAKVTTKWSIDYITTEDGQFLIGSWLQFQRVTRVKKSKRMNNNSSFDTRLNFAIDDMNTLQNNILQVAWDDVYMYSSDTIKWLYKYWKLIPWMQDSLHKIVTQNHEWNAIDFIYDIYYYERIWFLYFSYKAGNTYWVDYIDLNALETCTDWYGITDVFSGWTSLKKQINKISKAFSNVSWDNYIKLYYRVDNWEWELIKTFTRETNTIDRDIMTNIEGIHFKENTDVQFKVEFHNPSWWEDAPTLHELSMDYEIIKR